MQRLEVSGAVRPIYGSLGVKRLIAPHLSLDLVSAPFLSGFPTRFVFPAQAARIVCFALLHLVTIKQFGKER